MFVSVLRQHARIALLASRRHLPIASVQTCRTRLALPVQPNFQETLRTFTSNAVNRSYDSEGATTRRTPATSTAFVGNLPYSVDEQELRDRFSIYGKIVDIRVGRTSEGKSRGFAHVEFAHVEDARRAVEVCQYEPIYVADRDLQVDFAPERPKITRSPHYKLYIQSFDGDEDALRDVFQDHAPYIVKVRMMRDRETGALQKAGWVDFINVARAAEARNALQGLTLPDGSKFRVDFANKKEPLGQGKWTRFGGRGGGDRTYNVDEGGTGGYQRGGDSTH